jgi:hypothetical protein
MALIEIINEYSQGEFKYKHFLKVFYKDGKEKKKEY